MAGTLEIFRKELADHLTSQRLVIMAILVYTIAISVSYTSIMEIWKELSRTSGANVFLRLFTTQSDMVPSFLSFIAFFGPLISLLLVFDSVNRERSQGTVGIILSQPIHKDSFIIGKFAATSATILLILSTVIVIVTGIGIAILGSLPTVEETLRLISFLLITDVYLSFWIGLGLLFSIVFKREGTSALASLATWLFFTIFFYMLAGYAQGIGADVEMLLYVSPSELYTTASNVIMEPLMRVLSPVSYETIVKMIPNPLSFWDSILLIWPHITALFAGMIIIFIVSYVSFIKQEIRST
jgi:ABC-2 type transport system permease protein